MYMILSFDNNDVKLEELKPGSLLVALAEGLQGVAEEAAVLVHPAWNVLRSQWNMPYLFIFLQRKQEVWLSKEPAVSRRLQVGATTETHALVASFPGRPLPIARLTGSDRSHCVRLH